VLGGLHKPILQIASNQSKIPVLPQPLFIKRCAYEDRSEVSTFEILCGKHFQYSYRPSPKDGPHEKISGTAYSLYGFAGFIDAYGKRSMGTN
jgi:hypothetical protein